MAESGGLGGEGEEYVCSNVASQKSDLDWSGVAVDATNGLCSLWWVCYWAGVVDGMARGAEMWRAPNWSFFRSFGFNSLVELSNILCMYVGSTKCLGPPNRKSGAHQYASNAGREFPKCTRVHAKT
jgi:hypothetical protein